MQKVEEVVGSKKRRKSSDDSSSESSSSSSSVEEKSSKKKKKGDSRHHKKSHRKHQKKHHKKKKHKRHSSSDESEDSVSSSSSSGSDRRKAKTARAPSAGKGSVQCTDGTIAYEQSFNGPGSADTAMPHDDANGIFALASQASHVNPTSQQVLMKSPGVEDDQKMPAGGLATLGAAADFLLGIKQD